MLIVLSNPPPIHCATLLFTYSSALSLGLESIEVFPYFYHLEPEWFTILPQIIKGRISWYCLYQSPDNRKWPEYRLGYL